MSVCMSEQLKNVIQFILETTTTTTTTKPFGIKSRGGDFLGHYMVESNNPKRDKQGSGAWETKPTLDDILISKKYEIGSLLEKNVSFPFNKSRNDQ